MSSKDKDERITIRFNPVEAQAFNTILEKENLLAAENGSELLTKTTLLKKMATEYYVNHLDSELQNAIVDSIDVLIGSKLDKLFRAQAQQIAYLKNENEEIKKELQKLSVRSQLYFLMTCNRYSPLESAMLDENGNEQHLTIENIDKLFEKQTRSVNRYIETVVNQRVEDEDLAPIPFTDEELEYFTNDKK